MSAPALRVTRLQARRFLLGALGLVRPHASVACALAHHGYVQIDPINVCGRMHDLVLRARVAAYREGDLLRHLHGETPAAPRAAEERTAFEHHLPSTHVLTALEASAWPYLRRAMRERSRRSGAWSGRLTPREREVAARLLDLLAERGPLGPDAIDDPRSARRAWGSSTLAKTTLQKLFFHGRVLIARRDTAGRRLYDLPARVLPAAVLDHPETTPVEDARWEALLVLRQRRLARLKRAQADLVADRASEVQVEDVGRLWCLRTDLPALEAAAEAPADSPPPWLLAPLDPLLYDRTLTRMLWDFEYTWEVYTPPARRRRGYYALPLLSDGRLAGHVDPKADRAAGRLEVLGREVGRGHASAARAATEELAAFLALERRGR